MIQIRQFPLSVYLGLVIVFSAAFTRQVYNYFILQLGREYFNYFVLLSILILIILFFRKCFAGGLIKFNNFNGIKWVNLFLPVLVLITLNLWIEMPEEKVHVLIYGLLGWTRASEVNQNENLFKILLFVILFSISGELFQAVLPNRVCDVRDVFIDSFSGICGAILGRFSLKNT